LNDRAKDVSANFVETTGVVPGLPTLRGRGYRVRLVYHVMAFFFRVFHATEMVLGPRVCELWALPFAWMDNHRRRKDYPQFLRLREALPAEFWKGLTPLRHHRDMIWNWEITGGAIFHYHRLGLPYWQKRFHVRGTPPWELPEWGARPVVLAFLHTGAFALIPFWVRSRGIPAAFVLGGLPYMLNNEAFKNMRRAGDYRYGVEDVPLTFPRRGPGLRDAIRFLAPGRVLAMALDGGRMSAEFDAYDAGGFSFYAKQGASRIAAQTDSILMPVAIRCRDGVEFDVRFGRSVPNELLQKHDYAAATQHLITELWTDLRENPGEISWTTLEGISPDLKVQRTGWL
jgi:lauroyl/myristoyl acyltransferase